MNPLLRLLLATLAVPMQTHIFSLLPFPFPLDLTLIVTYYVGYFMGKGRGMYIGAYLGLLTDILSGEILGAQMFLKTLTGYLAAVFGFGISSRDFPIHFIALALFSFLNGLTTLLLVNLFGAAIQWKEAMAAVILPSAGLTALVGSLYIFLNGKKRIIQDRLSEGERGD
ncbi:MAG: rod shape-determining protein MreD [bacterium]|nr:rod shape-determining protein MreD [bacterium]